MTMMPMSTPIHGTTRICWPSALRRPSAEDRPPRGVGGGSVTAAESRSISVDIVLAFDDSHSEYDPTTARGSGIAVQYSRVAAGEPAGRAGFEIERSVLPTSRAPCTLLTIDRTSCARDSGGSLAWER